ncbi:MAG: type II toxin-antitoxin system VapC family toxin [Chloroflexota bacterium]
MGARLPMAGMIFVDSNIPMYVAGRDHPNRRPALRLLERARAGELELCSSTEVLQEILYRYVRLEQVELAAEVYDLFVAQCAVVLPVTIADTDRARSLLREVPGLGVRDAVHAAVMLENGIRTIATFDQAFTRISGIERLKLDG